MNRSVRALVAAAVMAVSIGLSASPAAAIDTGFTYQGKITNNNIPQNAPVDIQFSLWTLASGGSQVGVTQTVTNVTVTNGLFTTKVDFGLTPFDGSDRFLQIAVSPAGANTYSPLTARQKITATPYALYSANGGLWQTSGAGIVNTNPGFVGVNRNFHVTSAEFLGVNAPVLGNNYGGMYITTTELAGIPFYGYAPRGNLFDPVAWTEFDGSSGTWAVHNGGNVLNVTNTGRVGIGDTTPDAKLQVAATGIQGAHITTDTGNGINVTSSAANSYGINASGLAAGVHAVAASSDGPAILGESSQGNAPGVQGTNSSGGAAVVGYCNLGWGVYGQTSTGRGVYGSNDGSNSQGYAGYFNGRVTVLGTLTASTKNFRIDHPLDPANKYLVHTSVESPDMKTIYDGVVALDEHGEAVITMPEYFEALNKDFRYQLTCIGAPAQVYIAEEIKDAKFKIAGGKAGMKVSWQVTGIRHDAWANAHRTPVEVEKPADEKGTYTDPALYGKPATAAIGYVAPGAAAAVK